MIRHNIKVFLWIIVVFTLAVFFLLQFILGHSLTETTEVWADIGKTVFVDTIFVGVFNTYLWKCRLLHGWLVKAPVIGGNWEGEILFEYKKKSCKKKVKLRVIQSFFHIVVKAKTDESNSNSICASFNIEEEKDICQLFYTYQSIPDANVRKRSPIHYGTSMLNILGSGKKMEGNYWTDRGSQGQIILTKASPKKTLSYNVHGD